MGRCLWTVFYWNTELQGCQLFACVVCRRVAWKSWIHGYQWWKIFLQRCSSWCVTGSVKTVSLCSSAWNESDTRAFANVQWVGIWNPFPDSGVTRHDAQQWCLAHAFELVELNPQELPDEDGEFGQEGESRVRDCNECIHIYCTWHVLSHTRFCCLLDDFPESTGVKRIVQALNANVWTSVQMKDGEVASHWRPR